MIRSPKELIDEQKQLIVTMLQVCGESTTAEVSRELGMDERVAANRLLQLTKEGAITARPRKPGKTRPLIYGVQTKRGTVNSAELAQTTPRTITLNGSEYISVSEHNAIVNQLRNSCVDQSDGHEVVVRKVCKYKMSAGEGIELIVSADEDLYEALKPGQKITIKESK